jgi:hypothetical protein
MRAIEPTTIATKQIASFTSNMVCSSRLDQSQLLRHERFEPSQDERSIAGAFRRLAGHPALPSTRCDGLRRRTDDPSIVAFATWRSVSHIRVDDRLR